MTFENPNFDPSEVSEDVIKEKTRPTETGQERNRLHDLLWQKIIDENVNSINDIPPAELPRLCLAAEVFSQPTNFKELTDGAEDWQVVRAEKLINQLLLCNDQIVSRRDLAA